MSLTSSISSIATAKVIQSDAPSEKASSKKATSGATVSLHKLSLLAASGSTKRSRNRNRGQGFKPRRRRRPRRTTSGGSR